MLSRRSLFAVGGAALLLNGCAQVAPEGGPPLMDVIGSDSNLSSFRAALRSSGLASELFDRPGIYTVLAPTNLAWSGAPERIRNGDREGLLSLIAGGRLSLADIQARGGRVRMLSGIDVRVVGGGIAAERLRSEARSAQFSPTVRAAEPPSRTVTIVLMPAP